MVNSDLYLVYWVHLDDQKDPHRCGYIGVTSRSLVIRCNQHVAQAFEKDNSHIVFQNAIRKYAGLLKVDLLYVGTEEECYSMEHLYRPEEGIGWNIRPGGQHLDSATQKSFWNRPGYREGHVARMKNLWANEEFRNKNLPNLAKGVEVFQKKIKDRPWMSGRAAWTRDNVWPFADEYKRVWDNNGKPGRQGLSNLIGVDPKSIRKMHDMFEEGWEPTNCHYWQSDFRFGRFVGECNEVDRSSLTKESKKKISDSLRKTNANKNPWEFNRSNLDMWSIADKLHQGWIEGVSVKQAAQETEIPAPSIKNLYKRFKKGWEPLQDSSWIERFKG